MDHTAGQLAAVKAGAPSILVAVIHRYVDFADIAMWCCRALSYITALFRHGQEDAVMAGALPAIVAVVRKHSSVAAVAQTGCCTLDSIAANHPAGQQAAVDADAPAAVVAAMSAHAGVVDIAEQGCRALASMVAFFPAGQQAGVSAGAPDVIAAAMVRAMSARPGTDAVDDAGSSALHEWGCLALCRIAQRVSTHGEPGCSRRVGGLTASGSAPDSADSAVLGTLVFVLRSRLPTAQYFSPSIETDGVDLWVSVGSDADLQHAFDCARICGLYPLPSNIRIEAKPGVIAASGMIASQCLEARSDASGRLAHHLAIYEIRRLLPFVTIEDRGSPILEMPNAGSGGTVGGEALREHYAMTLTHSSTHVVVAFDRGIVVGAMVDYILALLRGPLLDISVWCAVETELALPQPSDPIYVDSPDIPALASRGILSSSRGTFLERVSRLQPVPGGPAPGGLHRVECSAGAWFKSGQISYLLASGHHLSSHTTCLRTTAKVSDPACEVLPFVARVDPSFIDADTPVFPMKTVSLRAVADIAVLRAPSKYEAGAVTLGGASFLDGAGLLLPPCESSGRITCSFPHGIGHFQLCGTARRTEGRAGYLADHVVYLARHTGGVDIDPGHSGSAANSAKGLHSFARSRVVAAPLPLCRAALLAGDESIDSLIKSLARDPRNVYLTFTPASCALAQAAAVLGVLLRDLSYTTSPVIRRSGCTVC